MSKRCLAVGCLIALLVLPLGGCWSRLEIEAGGFASLVAIDQGENGQIELTYSLAITESLAGGESGGGGDVPAWTVSSSGLTLADAIASSRTFSGRVPFWFHAQAVIIGEELAKQGISSVLDYALRTRDFRLNTPLLVAEGKAKDVLELNPKISKLPGRYLRDLLTIARENSVAKEQCLLGVIGKLVAGPGEEFYLPLVHAKEKEKSEGKKGASEAQGGEPAEGGAKPEEKPEALMLEGSAVFVRDRMVGKLDGTETRSLLWLRGEARRSTVLVELPEGIVAEQQIFARRTLKIDRAGDPLAVKIAIFQDGDVMEHIIPGQVEVNAPALKALDAALTATIQADVERTLQKLQQELRSDVLGIGRRVYRLYPELFNSLDWQEAFPHLPIEVTVQANFRRTGEAGQAPLHR